MRSRVQRPVAPGGRFSKADFGIDLAARTVTCPAGRPDDLGRSVRGEPRLGLDGHLPGLDRRLAGHPTEGRTEDRASHAPPRVRRGAYFGVIVEGGRRARMRGRQRVDADFALLGAAVNLARLAVLGLVRSGPTWAIRAT